MLKLQANAIEKKWLEIKQHPAGRVTKNCTHEKACSSILFSREKLWRAHNVY